MDISTNISNLNIIDDMSVKRFMSSRDSSYDESFEAIYNKAKNEKVSLDDAKDFLSTLSSSELFALEKYSMTPNKIDINKLDDESAYNLLLHFPERSDFDHDGLVENGSINNLVATSAKLPELEQKAIQNTFDDIGNEEQFNIMSLIFKGLNSNTELVSSVKDDLNDFEKIMSRIDELLQITDGIDEKDKESLRQFKEGFKASYNHLKENEDNNPTTKDNLHKNIPYYSTVDLITLMQQQKI